MRMLFMYLKNVGEMQMWIEQFLESKWVAVNEAVACWECVGCTKIPELWKIFTKGKMSVEEQMRKIALGGEVESAGLF
jgi:hypothetical protein